MLKQLGKYEILRTLGQGAMGEVYLAHHSTIGRDVAIKTILPSAAQGADAEERFRREATAAGKLNHPNLVTIHDFDKEGDLLYLVMEYVKGEDLEDIINQQSMTPSQFLEVLAQICDGLGYAHRNGIIHRDIKPSNIRVIRDGKRVLVKVMDFGIARTQDSHMTSTGIVMGTVSYMAPEYIQTGRTSAQGDLWAVGVMLYECLTCRKPFGGDNTTTILFKIVSDMPAPIDPEDFRGISPSVRDILDRALSKDPATRYQTAEEFAKALRACKDPSWKGILEGTSVMPAAQAGTVPLPQVASQVGPMVNMTPTAVMPAGPGAPTAMARPQPPTMVLPSPEPSQGRRPAMLALAVVGLLAVAGAGIYWLFGGKAIPSMTAAPSPPVPPAMGAPGAPPAPPAPAQSKPATPAAPAPKARTSTAPAAQPEASKPEPPRSVEETPDQKLARAVPLIGTDPVQALGLLRGLAAAQPADARIQGNLLAVLYRTRNAGEFERVLDAAKANGLSGPQMMKAAPAFRQAMMDESRAHKAKDGTHILSLAVVSKVVN